VKYEEERYFLSHNTVKLLYTLRNQSKLNPRREVGPRVPMMMEERKDMFSFHI